MKKEATHNFNNKVLTDIIEVALMYGVHALWFNAVKVMVENYVHNAGAYAERLKEWIARIKTELGITDDLIPKIQQGLEKGGFTGSIPGTDPKNRQLLQVFMDRLDQQKVVQAAAKQKARFA